MMLDLGFWVPSVALFASAGVFGGFAGMLMFKPSELLEKYGYSNFTSANIWAPMVSFMRVLGAVAACVSLLLLEFLGRALFVTGHVALYSSLVALMFVLAGFLPNCYRLFLEDPKSANNSETSVQSAKTNVMIFGSLTALLLLGFFFSWVWGPSNAGYVIDDYKGLPEELSMVRRATSRFLKQHILGHE